MANVGYPDTKNKKVSPLKSIGLIGAVRDVFTGAKDGAAKASPKPTQKKESAGPRKLGDNPVVTGTSPAAYTDKKKSEQDLSQAQGNLDKSKQAVKDARDRNIVKDARKTEKNKRKAARKNKRAVKKADKAAKITARKLVRKQGRADAITERGGTRVGAGIRKGVKKVGSKIKNVFKNKDKK